MSYEHDQFTAHGLTVKIVYDDDPMNPRDWDNASVMVCWHRRHILGDKHNHADPDALFADLFTDAAESMTDEAIRAIAIEAIRADYGRDDYRDIYRHWQTYGGNKRDMLQDYISDALNNGVRLSIIDALESAGYVILPLYLYDHGGITISTGSFSCPWDSGQVGYIYLTPQTIADEWQGDRDKAESYLRGEVETYDQYLTGDVYGFIIEDDEGDTLESCWGFFGADYCKAEAIAMAEHCAQSVGLQHGAGI